MEPVVAEILCGHEHDHGDDAVQRYGEQPVVPGQTDQRRRKTERQERVNKILPAERVGERGQVGSPVVIAPLHQGQNEALQRRNHDHDGKGELQHPDELGHG